MDHAEQIEWEAKIAKVLSHAAVPDLETASQNLLAAPPLERLNAALERLSGTISHPCPAPRKACQMSRRAAGQLGRAELLAKKGRTVGCVGCPPNWRTSGKPRGSSDLLELFRKMLHFGKIPKKLVKFGEN